jgi:hypothetical protein
MCTSIRNNHACEGVLRLKRAAAQHPESGNWVKIFNFWTVFRRVASQYAICGMQIDGLFDEI